MKFPISQCLRAAAIAVVIAAMSMPQTVTAAGSPAIREAQTIMAKYGIPTGPVDGYFGPQTARGLCAFRVISGATASRSAMNDSLLSKLRSYDKQYASLGQIPAPKRGGESTYLYVHEKCQVMLYAENGHYKRVMAVSTGKAGKRTETPNVTKRLGYTNRGWSCSTLWPESCRTHTEGRFANISDYGNMYNKRGVIGNILVHGSTFVPTYPDSHGCIRVTVKDADWMYDHVGNGQKPLIIITGAY